MNLTAGRTSFGRNNWPGLGAALAGLTTIGILAGIGIWQAVESDSTSTVAPAVPARAVDLPATSFGPTYVYLVGSQAEANAIYQADSESRATFDDNGTFNYSIRVIDLSKPEGQEEYRLMNAELMQVQMENPDFNLVQIIDLTVPATSVAATNAAARPVAPDVSAASTPTFFYVVNSQEQADQVLQSEFLGEQEAALSGLESDYHHTVIIDMSTLEGQQLYNTVNGELFEMWDNPDFDQSLVQIIDVR